MLKQMFSFKGKGKGKVHPMTGLCAVWGWVVNATPQGRSRWVQKISHPLGFDPWTVQPIASHYTNSTIPAHSVGKSWILSEN